MGTSKIKIRMVGEPTFLSSRMEGLLHMLDGECFHTDELYEKHGGFWWIAYDDLRPVGFAGVEYSHGDPGLQRGFLCRTGVLPKYRGLGLQRRFIKVREQRARMEKWTRMISYTTLSNYRSSNNLIACGYELYRPADLWGGKMALHWYKDLE